jgi:hypothetical protein
MGMSKQPKEIRDIEKQLKVTTIAVRDLHARAMELGLKDIEESAGKAHGGGGVSQSPLKDKFDFP